MNTTTVTLADIPTQISWDEYGEGHPVLLLHGGGGPLTVAPWGQKLAADRNAHVLVPVHPGFNGTPRPEAIASIRDLAALYVALLEELDLSDVTVVGNSIGGWITAEMALLASDRVSSYVVVDGVGVEVEGHPVADFFSLTFPELAKLSYADPATYGLDPSKLPPQALAAMAGNRVTLAVYAGDGMTDRTLLGRLPGIAAPVLVAWGEADRIGDVEFGRAFAGAIPGARFRLVPDAGHLPQIEQPAAMVDLVWTFADTHAQLKPAG